MMHAQAPRLDVTGQQGRINQLFYEHIPEMGLRNYWHPVARSGDVGRRPVPMTLMGDPVLLLRRQGKLYAVANECPHRGVRLHKGRCEFPGTHSITCPYHGWTFDVSDGRLLAVLTDGPDSAMVGRARLRTYPVQERQGIVWIWLADEAPVPVEQDIPPLLLQASEVRVVTRHAYGNWRWHAENPGMAHAPMLHRNSLELALVNFPGFAFNFAPRIETQGEDGPWLVDEFEGMVQDAEFPGLGRWPKARPGQFVTLEGRMPECRQISSVVSMRMPGVTRVINFPVTGMIYYEWYVQTDVDHFIYFQVACAYPETLMQKVSSWLRYYLWGRPVALIRFNAQDLDMVEDLHDYTKRHGYNDPAANFAAEGFQFAWRKFALANLRGAPVAEFADAAVTPGDPAV